MIAKFHFSISFVRTLALLLFDWVNIEILFNNRPSRPQLQMKMRNCMKAAAKQCSSVIASAQTKSSPGSVDAHCCLSIDCGATLSERITSTRTERVCWYIWGITDCSVLTDVCLLHRQNLINFMNNQQFSQFQLYG